MPHPSLRPRTFSGYIRRIMDQPNVPLEELRGVMSVLVREGAQDQASYELIKGVRDRMNPYWPPAPKWEDLGLSGRK